MRKGERNVSEKVELKTREKAGERVKSEKREKVE